MTAPITPKGHPRPPVGSRWWHTPTQRYVTVRPGGPDEQPDELTVFAEGDARWRVVRRGDLMREDLGAGKRT